MIQAYIIIRGRMIRKAATKPAIKRPINKAMFVLLISSGEVRETESDVALLIHNKLLLSKS